MMNLFKKFASHLNINFFIALSTVGLCWLQIRHQILSGPSGLVAFSRSINIPRQELDIIGLSGFYFSDFLICSIIVPLAISLISNSLQGIAKKLFIIFTLTIYILLYLSIAISLANFGSIPSISLIIESIQWAIHDPRIIGEYIDKNTFFKFAIISSAALLIFKLDLDRFRARIIIFFLTLLALSISAIEYSAHIGYNNHSISRPIQTLIIESLFDSKYDDSYKNEPLENLQKLFDKESNTNRSTPIFSNKKNAIIIILETAPYRLYSEKIIYRDLKTLLGDGHLYSMKNHHSTFPYTSDGIFSILTSLYPEGRRRILKTRENPIQFGWLSQLSDMNYVTTNYSPVEDTFEPDSIMYKKFGVANRVIKQSNNKNTNNLLSIPEAVTESAPNEDTLNIIKNDYFIFEQASIDALNLLDERRNFVFLLTPQIGHSPWPDLNLPDISDGSVTEKIWHLQYLMIDSMVNKLKSKDLLKDTVIIVTSDHGVRTKQEYEGFEIGRVTDLTYKVPLFVYSETPLPIENQESFSSHVDIGPSVLEWLGVKDSRKFVQGVSFSSMNDRRNIYLFGRSYLGVEGFYKSGRYFSYNYNSSTCETSFDLYWSTTQAADNCKVDLEKFYKIHNSVINKYVFGN